LGTGAQYPPVVGTNESLRASAAIATIRAVTNRQRLGFVPVFAVVFVAYVALITMRGDPQRSTCGGMLHTRADGTTFCGPLITPTKAPILRSPVAP
jgi:hypothetical protein